MDSTWEKVKTTAMGVFLLGVCGFVTWGEFEIHREWDFARQGLLADESWRSNTLPNRGDSLRSECLRSLAERRNEATIDTNLFLGRGFRLGDEEFFSLGFGYAQHRRVGSLAATQFFSGTFPDDRGVPVFVEVSGVDKDQGGHERDTRFKTKRSCEGISINW